jgi:hypothetical protein
VALLGTAVHLAVELLVRSISVEQLSPEAAWEAACTELTTSSGDPRELPGARRAALRFVHRAPELLRLIEEVAPQECLTEEELVSADGLIGGTADLICLTPTDLVVIDHKTGFVSDDGMPKAGYERQIRIYAGLASERFGRRATRGVLMSMREGVVDVDVDSALVDDEVSAARAALKEYNERVPGPQPAVPSLDVCVWCPHKARCDAFWDVLTTDWVPAIGECTTGRITPAPQVAANGLGAIGVKVRDGSIEAGSAIVIAEVPAEILGGLGEDDVIRVTGLRPTKSQTSFRWSSNALLHRC